MVNMALRQKFVLRTLIAEDLLLWCASWRLDIRESVVFSGKQQKMHKARQAAFKHVEGPGQTDDFRPFMDAIATALGRNATEGELAALRRLCMKATWWRQRSWNRVSSDKRIRVWREVRTASEGRSAIKAAGSFDWLADWRASGTEWQAGGNLGWWNICNLARWLFRVHRELYYPGI